MKNWYRGLQQLLSGQSVSRRPRSPRLSLEILEERSLLATSILPANVLQTNLVSDLRGVAQFQDPNLVNPWGIAESPGSAFWISDNNAGLSTLYDDPAMPAPNQAPFDINPLVVNIPTPGDPTGHSGAPDGTVFNSSAGGFDVTNGTTTKAAAFLFATEDGTIVGWNPKVNPVGSDPTKAGTFATIAVDNSGNNFTQPNPNLQSGAVYKGLAIATGGTTTTPSAILGSDSASVSLLYATNFRAGTIDVFDTNLHQLTSAQLPTGAFTDPNLPKGYAPFNIQALTVNGVTKLYVTYAVQDAAKHDDVAGAGNGIVDVYNLDGTGLQRLVSNGKGSPLDSPWGLAIAPSSYGALAGSLLVGNFGDGHINAFNASTGAFLGELKDPDGEAIQIDGLWALRVGNGGDGGLSNTVYFTAGLFHETHGLFGSLTFVPPGTPEGPAEAQKVTAAEDVFQLSLNTFNQDLASGASKATLKQDLQNVDAAFVQLVQTEQQFQADAHHDLAGAAHHHHHGYDDVFGNYYGD